MPLKGAELIVPLDDPDWAMDAMVLPCTLVAVVAPTLKNIGMRVELPTPTKV